MKLELQTQVNDYFFTYSAYLRSLAVAFIPLDLCQADGFHSQMWATKQKRSFESEAAKLCSGSQYCNFFKSEIAISESAVCRPPFGSVASADWLEKFHVQRRSICNNDNNVPPCHCCLDHLGFWCLWCFLYLFLSCKLYSFYGCADCMWLGPWHPSKAAQPRFHFRHLSPHWPGREYQRSVFEKQDIKRWKHGTCVRQRQGKAGRLDASEQNGQDDEKRRMHTENSEIAEHTEHKSSFFCFFSAFVSQNSKWCFCRYSWVLESPRQQYMLCVCMSSAIAAMCMCVFVYDVSLIRLKSEQFRSNDAGIMLTVDRARIKESIRKKNIKSFSFALCTPARVISGGTWREEDVREKQEQRKMDFRHVVF